jgi:hypothetical protein
MTRIPTIQASEVSPVNCNAERGREEIPESTFQPFPISILSNRLRKSPQAYFATLERLPVSCRLERLTLGKSQHPRQSESRTIPIAQMFLPHHPERLEQLPNEPFLSELPTELAFSIQCRALPISRR